jgi:hypothetical protein
VKENEMTDDPQKWRRRREAFWREHHEAKEPQAAVIAYQQHVRGRPEGMENTLAGKSSF